LSSAVIEIGHSLLKGDKIDIIIRTINATYAQWQNTSQDFKNNQEAMGQPPKSGGQVHHECWGMTIFASLHHEQKQFIKISLQYTNHHSSEVTLQITLGQ
jgi:hypothetical protein